MGQQTIRIPISVELFDVSTGETIWKSSSTVKSKIRNLTSEALAQNAGKDVSGEATIAYSRKQGYWNAFYFSTIEEFDVKIAPLLEIGLLRDLRDQGMLERKYLG